MYRIGTIGSDSINIESVAILAQAASSRLSRQSIRVGHSAYLPKQKRLNIAIDIFGFLVCSDIQNQVGPDLVQISKRGSRSNSEGPHCRVKITQAGPGVTWNDLRHGSDSRDYRHQDSGPFGDF